MLGASMDVVNDADADPPLTETVGRASRTRTAASASTAPIAGKYLILERITTSLAELSVIGTSDFVFVRVISSSFSSPSGWFPQPAVQQSWVRPSDTERLSDKDA
jgi:hypothetical protein